MEENIKQPLKAVSQFNSIISQNNDECNNTNKKDSFLLHNSQEEIIEALTDEEAGQLLKGLFKYNRGENPNFKGAVQIAFIPIRQLLDINAEKYYKKCKKLKENALKGGRPKKENNQTKPNGYLENQKDILKTNSSSEYEYEYEYDNDIYKEKINKKESEKIPTKEEIKKYCEERKNNIDVEQFYLYYSDRNWKNKDGNFVNWKLCVITWEKNDKKYNSNKVSEGEYVYNPNL